MYKLGCIPSKKDIRDYKIAKISRVEFPEEFSLEPPDVLDQGSVDSCSAHVVAEVVQKIFNKQFSVGWFYGNRDEKGYLGVGLSVRDALNTAIKLGCVPREHFDENKEMTEIYDLVNKKRAKLERFAKDYKIGSYCELKSSKDIKTALMRGLPVITEVIVRKDMLSTNAKGIINKTYGEIVGAHAVILYGWNQDGWLLQNSWGEGYANGGRAILPYDYGIGDTFAVSMTSVDDKNADIKKPDLYWLRELIMYVIKLLRKLGD